MLPRHPPSDWSHALTESPWVLGFESSSWGTAYPFHRTRFCRRHQRYHARLPVLRRHSSTVPCPASGSPVYVSAFDAEGKPAETPIRSQSTPPSHTSGGHDTLLKSSTFDLLQVSDTPRLPAIMISACITSWHRRPCAVSSAALHTALGVPRVPTLGLFPLLPVLFPPPPKKKGKYRRAVVPARRDVIFGYSLGHSESSTVHLLKKHCNSPSR